MKVTQEKMVLWYLYDAPPKSSCVLVGAPVINQTNKKEKVTSAENASPVAIREAKVERRQWAGHDTGASRVVRAGYLLTPGTVQKSLGELCAGHTGLLVCREMWLGHSDSA